MKKAFQLKGDEDNLKQGIIQHDKKSSTRLNKYISSSGFCSRREADRLIEARKVKIDGCVAQLGDIVFENQQVVVDGQLIEVNQERIYIALHKPVGIICTTDTEIIDNMVDFMDYPKTIFPIGRLDRESSGLILLTNDGDIVNKILRASNNHEKEYIVSVNHDIDDEFISKLKAGVKIYNPVNNTYQITKKAKVSKVGKHHFNIILSEGLNRQIRRMCTALGYKVIALQRIRVMNICLKNLEVGQWRYLNEEELLILNESLKGSLK